MRKVTLAFYLFASIDCFELFLMNKWVEGEHFFLIQFMLSLKVIILILNHFQKYLSIPIILYKINSNEVWGYKHPMWHPIVLPSVVYICVNLVHVEFEWAYVHSRIMQREISGSWRQKASQSSRAMQAVLWAKFEGALPSANLVFASSSSLLRNDRTEIGHHPWCILSWAPCKDTMK